MPELRVLVVEDDPVAAEAQRTYVERLPGFTCLGVAGTAARALQVLVGHLGDQLSLAAGTHTPGSVSRVGREREALQELVGGDLGLRVRVPYRYPLEPLAAEHVHDAPVAEIRHGEHGQALERGRVLERRAEQLARLREELEPPAGRALALEEP